MKYFRLLRYLIFRVSILHCFTSVKFIKIGWLEIEYQQIKDLLKYYLQILFKELKSLIVVLHNAKITSQCND